MMEWFIEIGTKCLHCEGYGGQVYRARDAERFSECKQCQGSGRQ
jgi:hypothetical protein